MTTVLYKNVLNLQATQKLRYTHIITLLFYICQGAINNYMCMHLCYMCALQAHECECMGHETV